MEDRQVIDVAASKSLLEIHGVIAFRRSGPHAQSIHSDAVLLEYDTGRFKLAKSLSNIAKLKPQQAFFSDFGQVFSYAGQILSAPNRQNCTKLHPACQRCAELEKII